MVLSQLEMSNLGCGGPGESIDTHNVGVWNKKDEVTFGYPRCPQCPCGPESAQNVKSWMWGSRGVHRHPYCMVWNKKDKVTFGYPRCPHCPGGPESAQNVKS